MGLKAQSLAVPVKRGDAEILIPTVDSVGLSSYLAAMAGFDEILAATDELVASLEGLTFSAPVTHVYNPLVYARTPHDLYVRRFAAEPKRVVFMGMNPGPWGMAQTGVPFGEVAMVREWMRISGAVSHPEGEHPKRPIMGFDCEKSEVSGRRLWGLFAETYPQAEDFFKEHYIVNYCPLVWMEESGRNRTPDKLPVAEMAPVTEACDRYVRTHLQILQPEWVVAVGGFAETCLRRIIETLSPSPKLGRILHPSPASPAANRDWAGTATRQLRELGIWS